MLVGADVRIGFTLGKPEKMVEAVAQKRALEGEGKAFVGVGGGGTSLDVESMGLGLP